MLLCLSVGKGKRIKRRWGSDHRLARIEGSVGRHHGCGKIWGKFQEERKGMGEVVEILGECKRLVKIGLIEVYSISVGM